MTFNKSDHLKVNSKLQKTPIAVIGIASVFPDASNVEQYWDNIINEVDSIVDIPESRWKIDDYYDPDPKAPDKSYSKRGAFLPDIDFNPMEFGLPPNILEVTDVSQLLALVVAKKVLEDAGYDDENTYDRDKIGITLGVGGGQKLITPLTTRLQHPVWKRVLTSSGISNEDADIIVEKIKKAYIPWEENSFPGMLGNVIAGRVANRLNLGGTNCVLDAACASSLTAMKMAISDLLEYRSEIMITGGVDTDNSPFMYLSFSKTPAFSPGDKSMPFDANSQGMLVGEGVGMVALKRLEDAQRDNDRIYAVIKGIGTSSDGKFKSIYAPRPEGQEKALNRAYEQAGVLPKTIGLIEAHGTGTVAGDEAEFTALKSVFGKDNPQKQYIAIGSVKSQIGHTKAAAGSAGFIKAALALYHKILPASINVNKPHPKMDIDNSPFYVNSQTRPWFPSKEGWPRRAGISAFGFGGTNFHVVLEEYEPSQIKAYRKHTVPCCIVISDSTHENLISKCRHIQKELGSENSQTAFANLIDQYKMAPVKASHPRLGFVCKSSSEALEFLNLAVSSLESKPDQEIWEHPKGIYFRKQGMETKGKVAALFSGQGSQYINMGKTLCMNFPDIMESFINMDKLFVKHGNEPLSKIVFPIPKFNDHDKKADQEGLQKTENVQPAIGAFSAGLYNIFTKAGFVADYTAGHSFGELTALWAAGVLTDKDYYFLAMSRGRAMAAPNDENFDAGTMAAVMGDVKNLKADISSPNIKIANFNSNTQVVIAGPKSEIFQVQNDLKPKGYKVIPLNVSAAFHTPLVGHAQKPFAKAVNSVTFNLPKCRVYSNSTAKVYPDYPKDMQKNLEDHILNSVLFKDEIENMYNDGARIFVEFGPKNVLAKLASNILEDKPHVSVAINANAKKCSDLQMREAGVQLCVAGIPLNTIDFYEDMKKPEDKKSGLMNIKLNGSNYVSEKTRKAYEDALNDGHTIQSTKVVTKIVEVPAPVENKIQPLEKAKLAVQNPEPELKNNKKSELYMKKSCVLQNTSENSEQVFDKIEQSIGQFFNHEGETLKVHSQYLSNAREYTKSFYSLMGQQIELLRDKPDVNIPSSIEKSMEMFHDYQGETLKAHTDYIEHQAQNSVEALRFIKQQYGANIEIFPEPRQKQPEIQVKPQTPQIEQSIVQQEPVTITRQEPKPEPVQDKIQETPVSKPAPSPQPLPPEPQTPEGTDINTLTNAMLEVVAEKTGYPTEMLELDMDMEADLGIDSIKRVEILAAVMEQFPELPEVNPDELAPLKTLGQIVDKLSSEMPAQTKSESHPKPEPKTSKTITGINIETLTNAMLEVVAEKTGYPTEMLELDMDMEADLGIDSIKRVEILAAVMEQFPELPEVNPDELAPLKTLGQIVDKLSSAMPPSQEEPESCPQPESQTSEPATGINIETLTNAMLEVVAEKTGYPTEMLELDMDMEADLGIDSIKRVEILAAVMDKFPELPEVNPDELSALKTLSEVVERMSVNSDSEKKKTRITEKQDQADQTIRSIVKVKKLIKPDFLEFDLSGNEVCLITDNGTQTTSALSQTLYNKGWKVVVLSFPQNMVSKQAALTDGIDRIYLQDMQENTLKAALTTIQNDYGKVGGFIHLNPVFESSQNINFHKQEKNILLHVFLTAKYLKSSLVSETSSQRNFFITTANLDGQFGLSGRSSSLVSGGLFGLTKTLNMEWPSVFCRAVDLGSLENDNAASAIISEIHDPDCRIVETAYSDEGRITLDAHEANKIGQEKNNLISSDSVFLVTGGAKGVTAKCIAKMAEMHPCKYILMGRSKYSNEQEPEWAVNVDDEAGLKKAIMIDLKQSGQKPSPKAVNNILKPLLSNREITKALKAVKKAGALAEYISADVTDENAIKDSLKPVIEKFGNITGIIHGAGVLADKLIENKTIEDFNAVYSTKINGLNTLLKCVDCNNLTHLSLFSSAAGFYGNEAQSDYAIANEILNKTAYRFKSLYPNCHVNTFNWGPWDGGMVTPELKRMFAQKGINVIPINAGSQLFAQELSSASSNVQILVGSSMIPKSNLINNDLKSYEIIRELLPEDNLFLQDHVIGENPVLPTVCATWWMADICEKLYPGFRFYSCSDYKLFKGIIFDNTQAKNYILNIKELSKTDLGEIEFQVKIMSKTKDNKNMNHYEGKIKLISQIPQMPVYKNFDKSETQVKDGTLLYQDGTLFHGPNFQAIERVINISENKLTMECRISEIPEIDQGQFRTGTFNPFAADPQFQIMLVWVRHYFDAGSLPTKAQLGEHFSQVPYDKKFYVSLDIQKSSSSSVIADITTHDEDGKIYTRVQGAEVTISKQLNSLFAKAV